MTSALRSEKSYRCPVCGQANLEPRVQNECFEYEAEGQAMQISAENVPVKACPACGEIFSGPEAGRIRDDAIRQALKVLMPEEIRALREGLGLTRTEFAHLTAIDQVHLAQWEQGQMIQSRAMDLYLRLLGIPENVRFVCSARNGSSPTIQKRASVGQSQTPTR